MAFVEFEEEESMKRSLEMNNVAIGNTKLRVIPARIELGRGWFEKKIRKYKDWKKFPKKDSQKSKEESMKLSERSKMEENSNQDAPNEDNSDELVEESDISLETDKILGDLEEEGEQSDELAEESDSSVETEPSKIQNLKFERVNLTLFRKYLTHEFSLSPKHIDDFVLLSVFVGNDFLKPLPGFTIRYGGLDVLMGLYGLMTKTGLHLVEQNEIHLPSLCALLKHMASWVKMSAEETLLNTLMRKKGDKGILLFQERSAHEFELFRQRYYVSRFGNVLDMDRFVERLCGEYIAGLVWVLRYYLDTVPTWGWFYPYHHAPIVTDLWKFVEKVVESGKTLTDFIQFEQTNTLRPLTHLVSILPPESMRSLPSPYRALLTPSSPLSEFFPPPQVRTSARGLPVLTRREDKIPFVDIARLLASVNPLERVLTSDEMARNQFGADLLFRSNSQSKEGASAEKDDVEKEFEPPIEYYNWINRRQLLLP